MSCCTLKLFCEMRYVNTFINFFVTRHSPHLHSAQRVGKYMSAFRKMS